MVEFPMPKLVAQNSQDLRSCAAFDFLFLLLVFLILIIVAGRLFCLSFRFFLKR